MKWLGKLAKIFNGKGDVSAFDAEKEMQKNFDTLREDGIRACNIGEYAYAVKCFQAAIRLKDDLKTNLLLARILRGMGRYEESIPLLKKYSEACPENSETRLDLADSFGKIGHWQDQADISESEISKGNKSSRAYYLASEAAWQLGDADSAASFLDEALNIDEYALDALMLRAKINVGNGQYTAALADADKIVSKDPNCEEALLLRATALFAMGKTAEAAGSLMKVTEINPFNHEATLRLAIYYENAGKPEEAEKTYGDAISADAGFAEAYKLRAKLREKMGKVKDASDDMAEYEKLKKQKKANKDGDDQDFGGFSNITNQWEYRYKKMNPYGFCLND